MAGIERPLLPGARAVAVIAVGLAAGVIALGCGTAPASDPRDEAPVGPLTFSRDVAPIVFASCAPCHHPGGSGPFSLLDYQAVSRRARQIAEVTGSRFMPPWLPEPGYGEFAGERRLTDTQIGTIARWVAEGAVEGDAADLPAMPVFTEGWQLGAPDLIVTLPRPYTLPAEGVDVFRNLVMPIPVSETRYVKTVELHPGSPQFVHHAIMAVDDTTSSRRLEAAETEQAGQPGFDGMEMGQAFMPDGHLMGWTPGMEPYEGVEGQAWQLDPGTDFVLQLHLLPSGKPERLEPVAGFYFADAAPTGPPLYLIRLDGDQLLDIPPGEKDFVVTDAIELPIDVEVHAVYPHAHYLAKTMEGKATLPDGTERWLIRIDDWDFNWQDVYRLKAPIALPQGTTLSMRYVYDNSADNPRNPSTPPRRVVAGNRSTDEMAHLQLQVRTRSAEDLVVLRESLYRHAIRRNPANPWTYYGLGNALWESGRLDEAVRHYRDGLAIEPTHAPTRNNLGAVLEEQGQTDEAIAQFREAIRIDPGFANAYFNLGNALTVAGRLDEAAGRYREALRLEPDFAEAHTNLGELLRQQGMPDEAAVHAREVVRLRPNSADAHNNLGAALAMAGELAEAIRYFQRALALEPDHAGARANLELALEIAREIDAGAIR